MKTPDSGLTLIELVMLILVLGILGATMVPKFTSLQVDAQAAETEGPAAAPGSGSAVDLATRSLAAAGR